MQEQTPPRIGKFILRKIYGEKLYDEISGDFEEVFQQRLKDEGAFPASLKYVRDALMSIRNIDLKEAQPSSRINGAGMIENYFKMAVRILRKNPATSLISILGFAVAIACTITSFLWADFMSNFDSFHTNRKNIYQVISHINEEGENVLYGPSPMLLGEHLTSEHTDVVYTTRMQYQEGNVRSGSQVFSENLLFVDPDFLHVFDFPLKQGNKKSLDQKQNIMLSEDMVSKYFGYKDPMGREISIKYPNGVTQSYFVSGVFAEFPENASFKPDIVLSISNYFGLISTPIDWSVQANATFVLLRDQTNPKMLAGLMNSYRKKQNEANPSFPVSSFEFFPLDGLGSMAEKIFQPVSYGNSPSGIYGIAIVGTLILVLACFNYVNIAVSSGTRRLKEIAVRKVMGSDRHSIIFQFLMENTIICGISVVFGTLLCYLLFLPGFNTIAPVEIPFEFSSMGRTIGFYLGIWLFVGILSGAYPAFYISRYQPSVIFTGKQKLSRKNYFSRTLLTLQFFMAFTTIVGSFIFTDNAIFVKRLGWGYDQEHIMSIKINDPGQFKALQHVASSSNGVAMSGGSKGHIGVDNPFINFEYLDKQFRCIVYDVSPGYLETLNVKLLEGRLFEHSEEASGAVSIVVNENFVSKMGWKEPVGKRILYSGEYRYVIGVISNIRHSFISEDVTRPMIFTSGLDQNYNFFTIRYAPGHLAAVDEALETEFHRLAPDEPYDRIYQSEIFNRYYDHVDSNITLMIAISAMAILLACLGLYGLVAYKVQIRIKEFGIRIILGAKNKNIIGLAVKEYAWIVGIAFILGVPIGSLLIHQTITDLFTVTKPFSMLPVLLAIAIALSAIALTIVGKIYQATQINPAETLRD